MQETRNTHRALPCLRVRAEITSQIWALRRPSGKARKRRNTDIFRGFATQSGGMHRRPECEAVFAWALIASVALAAVFVALFARSMFYPLSHDEHQFIAGGALLARHGALPYKDFSYNHMPYLAFIYGAVFMASDHLLLAARLISVVCAWLTLVLIFRIGLSSCVSRGRDRWFVAGGSALFLFANPLFVYSSPWAWNHSTAILAAVGGFLLVCRSLGNPARHAVPAFFGGVLLALAVGIRLSFAPLVVPFAVMLLAHPFRRGAFPGPGLRRTILFGAGMLVGLLPVFLLWLAAPAGFLFGNWTYPSLNKAVYAEWGHSVAMTAGGKMLYLVRDVFSVPGNLALLAACVLVLVRWYSLPSGTKERTTEIVLILLTVPFLLVGAFAPTPSQEQYFCPLAPFMVLLTLYGLADLQRGRSLLRVEKILFVALLAVTCIAGLPRYRSVVRLAAVDDWVPIQVHRAGVEVASFSGDSTVVTVAPTYPLEGRVGILESLATGPFVWRVGHLLPRHTRTNLHVMCSEDLSRLPESARPMSVLTGSEASEEHALLRFAQERRMRPVHLRCGLVLHVPLPGVEIE